MTPEKRGFAEHARELPPLGELIDFMRLIWALDHSLQRTSKRMSATLGITGAQRLVVRIVGRFPGILPGQLASILHVNPSTVTGIVERLAQRGLLSRQPDPRDRRRARLGLTAKGRALDVPAAGTVEAAISEALAAVPAAKIRDTAQVLSRLTAALEKIGRLRSDEL